MNIQKAKQLKEQILKEFEWNGLYYRFGTDNTILFTIEVYALFHELGIFDEIDAQRLHDAISYLWRRESGGLGNDIVEGLLNRNPGRDDRKEQWDNYEAVSCSVMFGDEFKKYSKQILKYGERFWWWSYDNRVPYKFSKHSFWSPFPNWNYFECCRQGWNIFTYKACANYFPGIINSLWYFGKVLLENEDPKATSGKLISWLRYKAIGNKWYIKPFKKIFEKKLKKLYGDRGIIECFRIYHGENSTIYKLAECLSD